MTFYFCNKCERVANDPEEFKCGDCKKNKREQVIVKCETNPSQQRKMVEHLKVSLEPPVVFLYLKKYEPLQKVTQGKQAEK